MNWGDVRLPDRLWSKIIPEPNSGCWLWIGTSIKGGYGRTRIGHSNLLVHRVTYTAESQIPEGLVIDHRCRNTSCCNPAHLEAVTQQINIMRSDGVAARRSRQTHCKRGHELVGENVRTFERSPGHFMRTCLVCERATGVYRRPA